MELTGVLNLVQNRDEAVDPDAEKIEELIAQRAAAKKEKNFAEADRIRGVLADMGVTIKDTRQGTQWSRNESANPDYLIEKVLCSCANRGLFAYFLHWQGILLTQPACAGQPVLRNAAGDFFTSN